jgi:hypothetical protein
VFPFVPTFKQPIVIEILRASNITPTRTAGVAGGHTYQNNWSCCQTRYQPFVSISDEQNNQTLKA